ncbi:MAG TPA: flavin reductase family protein [Acidimicrobiales bacterium]|jgi:flavin reductase (DIM6/NTAB) family NADH-FMN oxidoreductase RutF
MSEPEDPLAPGPDLDLDPDLSDTPDAPASADTARYRQVLGHFATGVTVVTAAVGGEPAGLAVNSFTSVSLEPPLVAICVANMSATWSKIREAGWFCVNVLADDQEDVCRVFAGRGTHKFQGMGWKPAESGAPILNDVLAWVDCAVVAEHDGGDHVIVIGEVRDMAVVREGLPLVFYRGGYGRFQP